MCVERRGARSKAVAFTATRPGTCWFFPLILGFGTRRCHHSFVHYAHESIDEPDGDDDDDDDDDVSESIILCASSQVGTSSCDKDTKPGKHGGVVCSTFCCCLLPQCFKQISDGMEELTVITGVGH